MSKISKTQTYQSPTNPNCQKCQNAKKIKNQGNAKVGDEIFEKLPPVDFGRIAAQTARQVITQNVRAAERERQYNDFIDKKGEILSGIVKRLLITHACSTDQLS